MYSIYLYITDEWFGSVVHRVLSALQFEVLYQIQFRALAAAAVSFLVVVVFGRRVIAQLTRMKIGDAGMTDADALKAHSAGKANTPTMGGVLIVGAIVATCLLLAYPAPRACEIVRDRHHKAHALIVPQNRGIA
ncbi:MAG: hypothetical protein IIC49_02365 [Planctomycetes bacterium]|nr:hypothetical protein [Planctomycetota bacterium]